MNDVTYEEAYKNVVIKIYQDDDTQSPEEWQDENLFLVAYHRDFTVDKKISQGLAQCIANNGKYEDDSHEERAKEIKKLYHIFGLEAYIHSDISLSLSREGNFPDRNWDVSQLGVVLVSKKEAKNRKEAHKIAKGLIETWNEYLSGEVYGYVIEDKNGEHLDSCWGFYGDYEENALKEARTIAEVSNKELEKKLKTDKLDTKKRLNDKNMMNETLGDMLQSKDETIKRHALGILKAL